MVSRKKKTDTYAASVIIILRSLTSLQLLDLLIATNTGLAGDVVLGILVDVLGSATATMAFPLLRLRVERKADGRAYPIEIFRRDMTQFNSLANLGLKLGIISFFIRISRTS